MKRATTGKATPKTRLDQARSALLGKRDELLGRHRALLHDEQELRETTEPDWEDAAAQKTATAAMSRLSDLELTQLERIASAIARIDAGTYGHCLACEEPIPEARLAVMPEAPTCAACASPRN